MLEEDSKRVVKNHKIKEKHIKTCVDGVTSVAADHNLNIVISID